MQTQNVCTFVDCANGRKVTSRVRSWHDLYTLYWVGHDDGRHRDVTVLPRKLHGTVCAFDALSIARLISFIAVARSHESHDVIMQRWCCLVSRMRTVVMKKEDRKEQVNTVKFTSKGMREHAHTHAYARIMYRIIYCSSQTRLFRYSRIV